MEAVKVTPCIRFLPSYGECMGGSSDTGMGPHWTFCSAQQSSSMCNFFDVDLKLTN